MCIGKQNKTIDERTLKIPKNIKCDRFYKHANNDEQLKNSQEIYYINPHSFMIK